MDFYSNLVIFYQTSPHTEGKLTSFVGVLAKKTCVFVVVGQDYTIPKSILAYWKRSCRLRRESCIIFQSDLTIFCKASPHFEGK